MKILAFTSLYQLRKNEKMNINIRSEEPKDYRRAEEVAREVFWNLYFPGGHELYGFLGCKRYNISMEDGKFYKGLLVLSLYDVNCNIKCTLIFKKMICHYFFQYKLHLHF